MSGIEKRNFNELRGRGRASKHPPELLGQASPPLMVLRRLVEKYNDQMAIRSLGPFPKGSREQSTIRRGKGDMNPNPLVLKKRLGCRAECFQSLIVVFQPFNRFIPAESPHSVFMIPRLTWPR
jgi:hypothetical protein